MAWINSQIVADHMKLADFIDELQRYSPERLRYDASLPICWSRAVSRSPT